MDALTPCRSRRIRPPGSLVFRKRTSTAPLRRLWPAGRHVSTAISHYVWRAARRPPAAPHLAAAGIVITAASDRGRVLRERVERVLKWWVNDDFPYSPQRSRRLRPLARVPASWPPSAPSRHRSHRRRYPPFDQVLTPVRRPRTPPRISPWGGRDEGNAGDAAIVVEIEKPSARSRRDVDPRTMSSCRVAARTGQPHNRGVPVARIIPGELDGRRAATDSLAGFCRSSYVHVVGE